MSAFREAVAEWNRRLEGDGWRSAFQPDLACQKCKQERCITLTTIRGRTTADCSCCGLHWIVE